MEPHVFEKGDKLYFVAPVSPFSPGQNEIEEFAFAEQLRQMAPNDNLMWLNGQYVEADNPNANGQAWTAGELAIKSLTPNFMPVTVMHDPRTAVGLIADTKLLTPEKDSVPRSRIDTTLGIWRHRFPEVAEEVAVNYEKGELMQSMECVSSYYSCFECGKTFQKLPRGAERKNWCEHLGEAGSNGRRILGNVIFTGTGLIFGTRGARGANDKAHLEVFQEEIAEYHEKAHRDSGNTPKAKPRSKRTMEIEDSKYQELLAAEEKAKRVPDLESRLQSAEEKAEQAEKDVERLETEKVAAEKERDDAVKDRDKLKEEANQATLSSERFGKLGSEFLGKLGDKTKSRLTEQAKSLSDEEWDARLEELSELTGVEPTADKDGEGGDGGNEDEFSREEIASSQASKGGGNNGNGGDVSAEARSSVVGKLFAGAKS